MQRRSKKPSQTYCNYKYLCVSNIINIKRFRACYPARLWIETHTTDRVKKKKKKKMCTKMLCKIYRYATKNVLSTLVVCCCIYLLRAHFIPSPPQKILGPQQATNNLLSKKQTRYINVLYTVLYPSRAHHNINPFLNVSPAYWIHNETIYITMRRQSQASLTSVYIIWAIIRKIHELQY